MISHFRFALNIGNQVTLKMKHRAPCMQKASNSAILSAAYYLSGMFGRHNHPKNTKMEQFYNPFKSEDYEFDPTYVKWNMLLNQSILKQ